MALQTTGLEFFYLSVDFFDGYILQILYCSAM